jgi:AbrB family looped-hinge helix DNA binding protein
MFYDLDIVTKKGGLMGTTTISPKFQVVIPKEVREKLHLKKGQKMVVIVKGGVVHMIPEKPLDFFKGFLRGLDSRGIREDEDRS